MKKIIIIAIILSATPFVSAQESNVLSLDAAKYLSANNEANKELEFKLFVQPALEDPKRNIDLRTLQNKIRNEYKKKKQ